jgi:hypothetical protein
VKVRPPRIFDATALVGWFTGHRSLAEIANQAEQGWFQILLPATAIADAEAALQSGRTGWDAIFYTPGFQTLPLGEHAAVEIGPQPGTLSARQCAHEAAAVRGVVVTRDPGAYKGLSVQLLVLE